MLQISYKIDPNSWLTPDYSRPTIPSLSIKGFHLRGISYLFVRLDTFNTDHHCAIGFAALNDSGNVEPLRGPPKKSEGAAIRLSESVTLDASVTFMRLSWQTNEIHSPAGVPHAVSGSRAGSKAPRPAGLSNVVQALTQCHVFSRNRAFALIVGQDSTPAAGVHAGPFALAYADCVVRSAGHWALACNDRL